MNLFEALGTRLHLSRRHIRLAGPILLVVAAFSIGLAAQQYRNISSAENLQDACRAGSSSDLSCVTQANFESDFPDMPRDQDDGAADLKPLPENKIDCSKWPPSQGAYCSCLADGGDRLSCADQSDTNRWMKCMASFHNTDYCSCVVNKSPYVCATPTPSPSTSPLFSLPMTSKSPKSSGIPGITSPPSATTKAPSSGNPPPSAPSSPDTPPKSPPPTSPPPPPPPTSTPFDWEQCMSDNENQYTYCACLEDGGTAQSCEDEKSPGFPTSTFSP